MICSRSGGGATGLSRRGPSAPPLKGEALARGMKVGLFGGTFDPPHSGHLHVARTALTRLGLDRIWWLVSPQNPLKDRRAGEFLRRFIDVEALADAPFMTVTDIERRLGVTRTADLIAALKIRYPGVDFVWVMGADNLRSFHRWARWRELMHSAPVAVISRPQDPVRARLAPAPRIYAHARRPERAAKNLASASAPAWTYLVEPLNSTSSTALRARRTR